MITDIEIEDIRVWLANRTGPGRERSSTLYRDYLTYKSVRPKLDPVGWGTVLTDLGYPVVVKRGDRYRALSFRKEEERS